MRGGRPGGVRALLAALAVTAAALAAALAAQLSFLLPAGALGLELPPVAELLVALVLIQGVGFTGVSFWVMRSRRARLGWPPLRWPSWIELRWVVRGTLLALAGALAGGLILAGLGLEPAMSELAEIGLEDRRVFLMLVPLAFLLIGPAEELLFRGVVQRLLRRAMGPSPAVLLASLIFAGAHIVALTGGGLLAVVAAVAVLFLPGLVLGAVYERTGNLMVPILVHGAYDATLFLGLYLALGSVQGGA
jgi:uncharacterized protein